MTPSQPLAPDETMLQSLQGMGLLPDTDTASYEKLAGGVSSDIWKVSSGARVYCVKRALAKLKVEADWFAPVERNQFEVAWYQIANNICPGSAPQARSTTCAPWETRKPVFLRSPGRSNCLLSGVDDIAFRRFAAHLDFKISFFDLNLGEVSTIDEL